MWIYLSLLVAVLGAFFYYAASNPKTVALGQIAFGVGLLAFLLTAVGEKGIGIGR